MALGRIAPLFAIRRQHLTGQQLGLGGERVVRRSLKRAGWNCLGARLVTRDAELDLAMLDGQTLVVVEVKTGRSKTSPLQLDESNHWRPGHRFRHADLTRVRRAAARMADRLERPWRVDLVELILFENTTRLYHHINLEAPLVPPDKAPLW